MGLNVNSPSFSTHQKNTDKRSPTQTVENLLSRREQGTPANDLRESTFRFGARERGGRSAGAKGRKNYQYNKQSAPLQGYGRTMNSARKPVLDQQCKREKIKGFRKETSLLNKLCFPERKACLNT